MTQPLHAGLVAIRQNGRWAGVLIEGPSGVGKSDLALRCLDAGFRLVADDRVIVWSSGGRAFGRAPGPLAGLIEARGVGILFADALPFSQIALVVRCVALDEIERLPEPATVEHGGVNLPLLTLWPLEPTAPSKMLRAVDLLGGRPQPAYQAPSRGAPSSRTGAT